MRKVKKYHVNVLLKRFHLNGHIVRFGPQTYKLQLEQNTK